MELHRAGVKIGRLVFVIVGFFIVGFHFKGRPPILHARFVRLTRALHFCDVCFGRYSLRTSLASHAMRRCSQTHESFMASDAKLNVLDLAADSGLRAYALGDLKVNHYEGQCLRRHVVSVFNLCRHLVQTALPGASAWGSGKNGGARNAMRNAKYKELYGEVEALLVPTHLVCNYQIAKRVNWKSVIVALVGLKHLTGYEDPEQEYDSKVPYPYERCAKQAVTEALTDGSSKAQILLRKNQRDAFGEDWNLLPSKIDALLRMIQDDMDSNEPADLDVDAVHDLIESLPLPPGVQTRSEIEAQERRVRIHAFLDDEDDDDFLSGQGCNQPEEKRLLTEAIWGSRNVCTDCKGSGFSAPTQTCPACKGVGKC